MGKNISKKKFRELIQGQTLSEKEISELEKLYDELGDIDIPEPSESMKSAFQENVEGYKLKQTRPGLIESLTAFFETRALIFKPAFATIILLVGIIAGMLINNRKSDKMLVSELQNTRETLMLTMLDQPSATERLKAVNLTEQLTSPDDMVIKALLATLNNDENVNVRLAAIDALFRYSNRPEVRKGLIEAIPHQNSPLILVTLSKAMVVLQEKESIESLKQLLNNEQLDKTAKKQITENIQKLI